MFYNGYDYAPVIVSFGVNDDISIINKNMQEKFYSILKLAEEKLNEC